jgi:hypothetical protein
MRAEMIKLGSGGGGQSCPAAGPFRVMCDRSLDPGDHRNRGRTESKCGRYKAVLRLGGRAGRISLPPSFHDIVFIKVLRTWSVVSLYEEGSDWPRLNKWRQEIQKLGERPVAEDPPTTNAHPLRNFRGKDKVSSMYFFYRSSLYLHSYRNSLTSRACASAPLHHLPRIYSFIIAFLRSCLTSVHSLRPICDPHPACIFSVRPCAGHADGVRGSIHRLKLNLFRPIRRSARLEV